MRSRSGQGTAFHCSPDCGGRSNSLPCSTTFERNAAPRPGAAKDGIVADKALLLRRLAVLLASGPAGVSLAARLAQAAVTLLEVDGASITIEAATPNRVTL